MDGTDGRDRGGIGKGRKGEEKQRDIIIVNSYESARNNACANYIYIHNVVTTPLFGCTMSGFGERGGSQWIRNKYVFILCSPSFSSPKTAWIFFLLISAVR